MKVVFINHSDMQGVDRQWLHSEVERKFSETAIARQYIQFF